MSMKTLKQNNPFLLAFRASLTRMLMQSTVDDSLRKPKVRSGSLLFDSNLYITLFFIAALHNLRITGRRDIGLKESMLTGLFGFCIGIIFIVLRISGT
jgi:hypothetical protein